MTNYTFTERIKNAFKALIAPLPDTKDTDVTTTNDPSPSEEKHELREPATDSHASQNESSTQFDPSLDEFPVSFYTDYYTQQVIDPLSAVVVCFVDTSEEGSTGFRHLITRPIPARINGAGDAIIVNGYGNTSDRWLSPFVDLIKDDEGYIETAWQAIEPFFRTIDIATERHLVPFLTFPIPEKPTRQDIERLYTVDADQLALTLDMTDQYSLYKARDIEPIVFTKETFEGILDTLGTTPFRVTEVTATLLEQVETLLEKEKARDAVSTRPMKNRDGETTRYRLLDVPVSSFEQPFDYEPEKHLRHFEVGERHASELLSKETYDDAIDALYNKDHIIQREEKERRVGRAIRTLNQLPLSPGNHNVIISRAKLVDEWRYRDRQLPYEVPFETFGWWLRNEYALQRGDKAGRPSREWQDLASRYLLAVTTAREKQLPILDAPGVDVLYPV